jgi:ATP-binding cassette subfamily F protein 3
VYAGTVAVDTAVRVGLYEQEISSDLFEMNLSTAIEHVYMKHDISINETKVRQLLGDYLFEQSDGNLPVSSLSGGQKARLQLIAMLANNPNVLILDEPTNHLDLPSIEELEAALDKYKGAILYVSHDSYFQQAIGGAVVHVAPPDA